MAIAVVLSFWLVWIVHTFSHSFLPLSPSKKPYLCLQGTICMLLSDNSIKCAKRLICTNIYFTNVLDL